MIQPDIREIDQFKLEEKRKKIKFIVFPILQVNFNLMEIHKKPVIFDAGIYPTQFIYVYSHSPCPG